jgi:hypothetical protein
MEHKIGIHDVTWAPKNLLSHPWSIQNKVIESGAEFWAHMPNWRDLFISDKTFKQLDLQPRDIDNSWGVDRAVEIVTPLKRPVSVVGKVANTITSVVYPIPPFAKSLTERELSVFDKSNLISRWPVIEDGFLSSKLMKRNRIVQIMSPQVTPEREILDVHSTNLELSPQQLLDWQKQGSGRRLMVSAIGVDERLDKYSVRFEHDLLIDPLLPYVSVVTLKIEDMVTSDREVVMTRSQIIEAIYQSGYNNPYAEKIKTLSQVVGSQSGRTNVDWMIKIKNLPDNTLVPKFVEYIDKLIR